VSDAILGAATGAAVVLALFRFGMLALAAFIASHTIYTTGAFTLLAVVAAAAYAAYVAIGRPPILPRRQTSQTN
jgi:hypothetical protein